MNTPVDDTVDRARDALVRAAYHALLQREPDADALAAWRPGGLESPATSAPREHQGPDYDMINVVFVPVG